MKVKQIKDMLNTIFTCLSPKIGYQLLYLCMVLTYHKSRWVKEMLNIFLLCFISLCI